MKTYEQTLTGAGTIEWPGGYQFLLLEASAEVDIVFFGPFKQRLDEAEGIEAGLSVKFPDGFSSVHIISSGAVTVKAGITHNANADYNKLPSLTLDSPSDFISVSDVTLTNGVATVVLAANTSRRNVIVTSLASNSVEMRVGDSNVSASRGTPLQPGESLSRDTQGVLYAYVTGAANQKVAVTYTQG